ncbi:hypothetical protein FQN54_006337 [Arachnomyces sp. PD_36]|nr:hypothetical protein FQN54_006337 [Arachnomyces sp. PD_36]
MHDERALHKLDINPSGGLAIFPLKNDPATYCCGTPISDGDKVVCPVGDENGFEIDSGRIVFGRAGLFNESATGGLDPPATGTAAPGTSPTGATDPSADNSCHQTAVGAGVGVPLGIITLASILWAIWERRKSKAIYGMHRDMPAPSPAKVHELHHDEPRTELDNRKFVPEIMGSERPRS